MGPGEPNFYLKFLVPLPGAVLPLDAAGSVSEPWGRGAAFPEGAEISKINLLRVFVVRRLGRDQSSPWASATTISQRSRGIDPALGDPVKRLLRFPSFPLFGRNGSDGILGFPGYKLPWIHRIVRSLRS